MTGGIGPVPVLVTVLVLGFAKSRSFQSREQGRRRSGTKPSHHLNVVLSKAALSGPFVCLRARAPCPLRVSCPVTDHAESSQLFAPSRSGSRESAAQLHVLTLPVAPWVKTPLLTHPPRFVARGCYARFPAYPTPSCPIPCILSHELVECGIQHTPPPPAPSLFVLYELSATFNSYCHQTIKPRQP